MHHGKLMAQYRENMSMTQEELADELHTHVRTVQRLESKAAMRSINRRWLLVGLLGIPASQLDLTGEPPWSKKSRLHVNNDTMGFFENELAMRWEVHKVSGPRLAAQGMDMWMTQIKSFTEEAQGTPWHRRALAVLSLSYQLEGSILRDTMVYNQAHEAFQNAFRVAGELENPELIAAALLREGTVYIHQEQPLEAIKFCNGALEHIKDLGFLNLRGNILQARAEAYALAQKPQDCWRSIGLAEHILGQENQREEKSYIRFHAAYTTSSKGVYALLLHDYGRAIPLLDKGLMTYDPTSIPSHARFWSRKAEACYGARKIDESIEAAQKAFDLAHSVGATHVIERVQKLHTTLDQSRWRNEKGMRSLAASLAAYYEAPSNN